MDDPLFNIVLYQPQIPQNTGNIGRTAMATHCRLHIVHPISFSMDEKARRRAGLDYWHRVDCREHGSWESFVAHERPARLWLFTTRGSQPHWGAQFLPGDYLLFGQEQHGVPDSVHGWVDRTFGEAHRLRLPMVADPAARSLNLATAVACGVYEGLRQVCSATGQMPAPYIESTA
jgi:tRNA (cytidine/uridine-2'-O-)-methyltransferase